MKDKHVEFRTENEKFSGTVINDPAKDGFLTLASVTKSFWVPRDAFQSGWSEPKSVPENHHISWHQIKGAVVEKNVKAKT